jgi:hypothetical protein
LRSRIETPGDQHHDHRHDEHGGLHDEQRFVVYDVRAAWAAASLTRGAGGVQLRRTAVPEY